MTDSMNVQNLWKGKKKTQPHKQPTKPNPQLTHTSPLPKEKRSSGLGTFWEPNHQTWHFWDAPRSSTPMMAPCSHPFSAQGSHGAHSTSWYLLEQLVGAGGCHQRGSGGQVGLCHANGKPGHWWWHHHGGHQGLLGAMLLPRSFVGTEVAPASPGAGGGGIKHAPAWCPCLWSSQGWPSSGGGGLVPSVPKSQVPHEGINSSGARGEEMEAPPDPHISQP